MGKSSIIQDCRLPCSIPGGYIGCTNPDEWGNHHLALWPTCCAPNPYLPTGEAAPS